VNDQGLFFLPARKAFYTLLARKSGRLSVYKSKTEQWEVAYRRAQLFVVLGGMPSGAKTQ